jgi:hypothetical protein
MVRYAKSVGWSGPPFDPWILASILGIHVEETNDEAIGEGQIFPLGDKVIIQCRAGRILERQRFTICHEIAHTCFPDVYEFVRRQDPEPVDEAHRKFENLCDIGAGELIMPQEDFLADLNSTHVCLPHACALGSRYVASIEAAIRRVLGLCSHPCAAAFLTDEDFKDFRAVQGRMRVRYYCKSTSFNAFFKPGLLLPAGSCAVSAPESAEKTFPKSRETWWINGKPRSWYVEALRLPVVPAAPDYPKAVALLHARVPLTKKLVRVDPATWPNGGRRSAKTH